MEEQRENLLAIFRREPDQTNLILRVALAAPIAIIIWQWLAGFAIPLLAVEIIITILIALYGGVLVYLAARLVHEADRWQVESAMQARRLLSVDGRRGPLEPTGELAEPIPLAEAIAQVQAAATQPVLEPARANPTAQRAFHQAQFLMQLQEEVYRARREGHEMSVMALDVTFPHGAPTPYQLEKLSLEMAHLAVHQVPIEGSVNISDTEYVFGLPTSDRRAAKAFVSKVVQALGDYWCHYGVAVYPDDGTDAQALFDYARRNCEESRQGKKADSKARPSKLVVSN